VYFRTEFNMNSWTCSRESKKNKAVSTQWGA